MSDRPPDPVRDLRIAIATQDGPAVVAALVAPAAAPAGGPATATTMTGGPTTPPGGLMAEVLQMAGDGLLIAIAQDAPGSRDLASVAVAMLRDRDRAGDAELADQLDAALGIGPQPMLRPLPVDLEELSMILEGDRLMTGGRIDLRTGDVNPNSYFDSGLDEEEDEDDPDDPERWLHVWTEGSRDGYRDMVAFLDTITDEVMVERLERSLEGRGAFRRFKDRLADVPGELERFFRFTEERKCGRARAWLAAAGYRPVPRPRG
jgi:hypothetical protein